MLKRLLFVLSFPACIIAVALWLLTMPVAGPMFYIITGRDYIDATGNALGKFWSYFDE